jgi:hypothetical protein
MGRRVDVEPDNVGQLGGKAGIARTLEGAQPVRLQFVLAPDALHRPHGNADRLGHRPAGPVGRLVRRLGARQRHHPRRGFRRDRRLAGLAGLVAQQTFDPAFGKALLPALHRRPADADAVRHLLRRVPIRRGEHDTRRHASAGGCGRPRSPPTARAAVLNTTQTCCAMAPAPHTPRPDIAYPNAIVNPLNDSKH